MQSAEFFDKTGYVVLSDALTKQRCDDLVQYMFDLKKQGKTVNDPQCPLSDAIYGDPIFDKILQDYAKPIGDQVGKTLLPTYTYARIYRKGEVLKKHTDRPSCEISATMTLGFDNNPVWPIFFDEQKCIPVSLNVGEMAVYKGCDVVHWRTEFKGEWHVQVFFHYVDANGPHKDHYKDGRQDFGVDKNQTQVVNQQQSTTPLRDKVFANPVLNAVIIPSSDMSFPGYTCIESQNLPELKFTKEECDRITAMVKQTYPTNASVGGTADSSRVAKQIRSADIYILENDPENSWIFAKVARTISVANSLHFGYDISGITHGIQLIHYRSDDEVPGHYDWHVDAGPGEPSSRKISFTAQLSPPDAYEGCELIINNNGSIVSASKEQGSIHLFPSYMLHRVTPVTKGERFALVIWIHGSTRFK
jgi:PKHD-type hydroxylase